MRDDTVTITVRLTPIEAWGVYYALSNIRDGNLLNAGEIAAIELVTTRIAAQLRAQGEGGVGDEVARLAEPAHRQGS